MMQELMISIYQWLHNPQSPLFVSDVYVPVGVTHILLSLGICIVFYYLLNWFRERYSSLGYWILCVVINLVLAFLMPIIVVQHLHDDQLGPFSSETLVLSLINAAYSVIFFFVLSMILKWGSPHARRIPF